MIKPMRGRTGLGAALVLAATLVGVGCGSSDSGAAKSSTGDGTTTAGAASSSAKTYTVGIDIPFHPIFDYVQANSAKYFAGKPYKVNFKVLDSTTQVPAFGKGDLDVMTTPPSFIPRVEQQYGIKAQEFFPLARWTTGPQILVKKDSPYKTIEDLKGKTVAIPPLNTRFGAEEAAVLAATGINIRQYFKLKETDAAPQQLNLGRADAGFIEAPTTYPLLQGGKFKAIYSVSDAFKKAFGDAAVVNGGYIATASFIAKNRPFVDALVAATQDAWNEYNKDPDAVNKVASKVSGIAPEQLAVVGKVLDLNGIPQSERAITQKDVATWTKIFPLLVKSGFLKQAPADAAGAFVVTGG